MTSDQAVTQVLDVLESLQIPYMIVGSLASTQYGISRSTKDADIVVELGSRPIQTITRQLSGEFQLNPQIMFETVTGTTRHLVNIPEIPFVIEFFRLSSEDYDQKRFARRRRMPINQFGREAWLLTPEDVIVTKLRWAQRAARGKDADDVRDVITVQEEFLDWDYIHGWCEQHGTRELLQEIREQIPR